MNAPPTPTTPPIPDLPDAGDHQTGQYEIRLKGHLAHRWDGWFDGMLLTHGRDGTTVISGPVADQAALHGLLRKVRDLGLPLVSVCRVTPDKPEQRDD